MIVLFTDFGLTGPYVGQVKAVLARRAPTVRVIDLFADAPAFEPKLGAYLLAAYAAWFEPGDVIVAVVDPGVGSDRLGLVLEADGRWFVGPDNGLFEIVHRRSPGARAWPLDDPSTDVAPTFHGRDVFAPAAAALARGWRPAGETIRPSRFADWPDDLPRIVYVDVYGNLMTGLRASALSQDDRLALGDQTIARGRTFSDVQPGELVWYENANGLAEVARRNGSAAATLGLGPGAPVEFEPRSAVAARPGHT